MSREQIALFSPTLDSVIADDDPVRLFDEILAGMDWSQWESEYHGRLGIRQFLLRGLVKVKTEWTWAATAFNLAKLVREVARLRAEFMQAMLTPAI